MKCYSTLHTLLDVWVPHFEQDKKGPCPYDAAYILVNGRKIKQ